MIPKDGTLSAHSLNVFIMFNAVFYHISFTFPFIPWRTLKKYYQKQGFWVTIKISSHNTWFFGGQSHVILSLYNGNSCLPWVLNPSPPFAKRLKNDANARQCQGPSLLTIIQKTSSQPSSPYWLTQIYSLFLKFDNCIKNVFPKFDGRRHGFFSDSCSVYCSCWWAEVFPPYTDVEPRLEQ